MFFAGSLLSSALVVAILGAAPSAATCGPPTATTLNGTYVGERWDALRQDIFRGIPFAQPPVGDLRYAIPKPLDTKWNGTRNATVFSPSCVGDTSNAYSGGTVQVSEDCLTLNVIRPSGYGPSSKLPVVVWIYGGGFRSGGSSLAAYNQSWIVNRAALSGTPIVAVSINYRVGGFGWLWSNELKMIGASNLGFRDQRLALHWIQENIAAFGGDPTKVVIQGESAGGVSVGHHLVAYGGRNDNLFRGAIAQSGTPATYKSYDTADQWQPFFNAVANATNCSRPVGSGVLACLRKVPVADLSAALISYAPNENPYTPLMDGDIFKISTTTSMKKGEFLKVPFIVGTNFDEGATFAPRNINTTEQFIKSLSLTTTGGNNISDTTGQIIAALWPDLPQIGIPATYHSRPDPSSGYGYMWKRAASYAGDQQLHSSRRLTSQMWAKYSNVSLFSYHFNVVPQGAKPEVAVSHGVEIPFSFYNVNTTGFTQAPATYTQISGLMTNMWISFITTLSPNAKGHSGVSWPPYSLEKPQNLVFDVNVTNLAYLEDDIFRAEAINFLIEHYEEYWGR
ncbi:alpha/beta-hydrolase [Thozetella sp. PMI_491]|nr:alpha/beta-hydrolase [Thozetella sp. PMI_491]